MNEQPIQAYLTLIQSLLSSAEGEENNILEQHQDLIDEGFFQIMISVAQQFQEAGNENAAKWLINLARQLGQRLGFSLTTTTSQEYYDFLMELLEKIFNNSSEQSVSYFLEQNLDKLDEKFRKTLEFWPMEKLTELKLYEAYSIAEVMVKLSNLIAQFDLGKIATNQEIAITGYKIALTIFTFDAFPQQWAMTLNNLGNAYHNRILGYRAENLEQAIAAYQEALKVRTRKDFPQQWAMTQNNLGTAYSDRIQGDRSHNLEQAIAAYQKALEVYTFEDSPVDWAATQNNVGIAYYHRIRGYNEENLKLAIAAYEKALKVRTCDDFPIDWAATLNNLGNAYLESIGDDRENSLEQAISAYSQALKVYTCEAFPKKWAATLNNLGNAYLNSIGHHREENLEQAIMAYNQALKVFTFEAFPIKWAMTQNNLANAYNNRIQGNRAENLKRAIAAYEKALKIRTKENDPIKCLQTARNLGNLHYTESNWKDATVAYHLAIEALEASRLEALNPQRKQEILSEAIEAYHRIVQAYLNLNQPEKALEYVERSKTRYLVEILTNRDLYPKGNIPETVITQLDRLRRAIVTEANRIAIEERNRNYRADNAQPGLLDYTQLNQLKSQLDELIEQEISPIDPNFILTEEVKPISLAEIQSLLDEQTAILEWYITEDKILTFIITSDLLSPPFEGGLGGIKANNIKGLKIWQSSAADRENLINWINEYLQAYYQNKTDWKNSLTSRFRHLSKILYLDELLNDEALKNSTRLILIPHWFLHILPLHTLPLYSQQPPKSQTENEDEVKYLFDLFPQGVSYAPSCQLLKITQNQLKSNFNNFFAIQNPTNNLCFTNLEVETIKSCFPSSQVLAYQTATKTALKASQNLLSAHCIHFSCHGTFNLQSPLESALILADNEKLTLGEIFELDLKQCRLITLSACETGLIDVNTLSDEYVGLPSGFLFAGSPTVISSLWTVNDLSTAFLQIKFYQELQKYPQLKRGEIALSLKAAQNWLRTLTLEQFEQELKKLQPTFDSILAKLGAGKNSIYKESLKPIRQRQPYPFQNPYYWAGFTATGF